MRRFTQRKEKPKGIGYLRHPWPYTKELLYVDYRRRETQKQFHFSVADNIVAVLFVYGQGNRVAVAFVLPQAQNLKTV